MSTNSGHSAGFLRRHLLRAMGATLTVPLWAQRTLAAPPAARLVLVMQTNGTSQRNFWPNAEFRSPILAPLLDDPRLKPKTTIVKGLFNDELLGNGHDDGWSAMWSGHRCPAERQNGGISIDQFLKQKGLTRAPFPALGCGPATGGTHRTTFSYLGKGQPVPADPDVYGLYTRVFGAGAPGGTAPAPTNAEAATRTQRSILDYVARDLTTLAGRVGSVERVKLDQHATALREFEQRLNAAPPPPTGPGPQRCEMVSRPASPVGDDPKRIANYVKQGGHAGVTGPLFADFIALALACNMTSVVTFQVMGAGNHAPFAWLGTPPGFDYHFDCAHRDSQEGNPAVTPYAVKVSTWYAELVARIARGLDSFAEAGGTALDGSLVAWANDMGSGNHRYTNIPLVFVGSAGGRLKRTGVFVDQGPQNYRRAGATVLNLMGYPTSDFGSVRGCGTLAGVAL